MDTREALKAKWMKIIDSATEYDSWGQVVEAIEQYDRYR